MTSSKCCNWLFKRACAFPLDGHQYGDFPFFWILFPTYPMPKRYTAVDPFKIHPLTLGACGCQLGACGCHFWNMVLLLPPLSWAPVAASLAPVAAGGGGIICIMRFFPTYPMPKRYTPVDPFKIHPLTLGACGCQLGACGCQLGACGQPLHILERPRAPMPPPLQMVVDVMLNVQMVVVMMIITHSRKEEVIFFVS